MNLVVPHVRHLTLGQPPALYTADIASTWASRIARTIFWQHCVSRASEIIFRLAVQA